MSSALSKYSETILRLISEGKDLTVVMADGGEANFNAYRISGAERCVNVGIAEQNLLQVACGLALSGQKVVTLQKAPFSYTRTLDQLRNAVALMNLPISMVSESIGLCDTLDGSSHYGIEELSIVRTIPNLKIINLTDEIMAEEAAKLSLTTKTPLYIRVDTYSNGVLYDREKIDFAKGFSVVKEGTDLVLVSTGYYTKRMIKVAECLDRYGIDTAVIDLYGIPFDEAAFFDTIGGIANIVSVEEHVLQGGIGSLLLEIINRHEIQKRVKCIGIDFDGKYPSVFGSREYFMRLFGLSDKGIMHTILQWYYGLSQHQAEQLLRKTPISFPNNIPGYGECLKQKKHIILVGSGAIGQKALNYFGKERVAFFADNSSKKIGTKLEEIPVIAVSEIPSVGLECDIVISTNYYDELGKQLENLGISEFYKFLSVFAYEMEKEVSMLSGIKIILYGIGENTRRVLHCLEKMKQNILVYITEEEDKYYDFFWGKWLVSRLSEQIDEAAGIIICKKETERTLIEKVQLPVIDSFEFGRE